MKFLDYIKIKEPSEIDKKEMYRLYSEVFKTHFPITNKDHIMTSILGRQEWTWRVVGITEEAIKTIIGDNYKSDTKRKLQRDHYYQDRNETYKQIFEKFHPYEDWWNKVWDNDRTILMTKSEHSLKKKIKIYDLDWKLGLFRANGIGFKYAQGREGFYIKENYSLKV